jgi:hypothetical protein
MTTRARKPIDLADKACRLWQQIERHEKSPYIRELARELGMALWKKEERAQARAKAKRKTKRASQAR